MKLWGRKNPEVDGKIGYYDLSDWWFSTFSEEERKYIEKNYKPFGASPGEKATIRNFRIVQIFQFVYKQGAIFRWFSIMVPKRLYDL